MPAPGLRKVSVSTTVDVALTAATEAVILTLPGLSTEGPSQIISIFGSFSLTTAAGATATTLRVRRNNLTGTLVGEANAPSTAATSTFALPFSVDDSPGEVASQAYVVTATVTGGNGTSNAGQAVAVISST